MPRLVQTVLFTDVVASTDRLQQVGDAAWVALLGRHHDEIRSVLDRYDGVEVDTAGDGFFAVFDAPRWRCAPRARRSNGWRHSASIFALAFTLARSSSTRAG